MPKSTTKTKKVHLVLQGKGGCGKTVTSVLLSQVLKLKGEIACMDTDPVNASFSQFLSLGVNKINIVDDKFRIEPRMFDAMMEQIVNSGADNIIIDTGSQTFLELSAYLVEADALNLLIEMGIEINAHVIVTGGPSASNTFHGLHSILQSFPEAAKITVWENEYFGPVEYEGTKFTDTKVYKENKSKIHALIRLQKENTQTTERDISEMFTRHQTYDEAIASEETLLMTKRRLKVAKDGLYGQINAAI